MTADLNIRRMKNLGIPFGLAGALAIALAASTGMSVTVDAKPSADRSAAEAQKALKAGKVDKAVELTEALVAANPREPSYRALLAHAYLRAGRFEAATTTFEDAAKLGDKSSRTALALALAHIAGGRNRDAVAVLDDWRDAIPAADRGLALALAGETGHGVAVLADALRQGDSSAKTRQNLAYAYALDGRWREARVMIEQDVPANLVDERISEWAARARPEDHRLRVAKLIGAPLRSDPGQPQALALVDSPATEQLAAEKVVPPAPAVPVVSVASAGAVAKGAPVAPVAVAAPVAPASESNISLAQYRPVRTPAPAARPVPAPAVAAAPMVQHLPASYYQPQPLPMLQAQPKPQPQVATTSVKHRASAQPRQNASAPAGSHRVQLGAFSSEQGARRAWSYYAARNPELKNYKMVITQATVGGKRFWRVAADGLNGRGATGLCSTVKARGGVCFAYSLNAKPARSTSLAKVAKPAPKPAKTHAQELAVASPSVAAKGQRR